MKKIIYLLVSEDNYVYGYQEEKIEADYAKEYEVDENFHQFYLTNLGKLYFKNNQLIIGVDKEEIIKKINELLIKLGDTDYQIIKCYEAQLLNEDMPYNLQELLSQRKAWREEINNLQFQIAMI